MADSRRSHDGRADDNSPDDEGRTSQHRPALYEPHDEVYHFIVLDATHTKVLTAGDDDCWILPFAVLDELSRQTPRLVAPPGAIAGMFGMDARPIHEALLPDTLILDAANVPRRASNRYLALEVEESEEENEGRGNGEDDGDGAGGDTETGGERERPDATAARFSWKPVSRFLGDESLTRLPIQMAAVRACLARFGHPMAPFDSPGQVRAAGRWTTEVLEEIEVEAIGEPVYHRMDQFDRVVEIETTIGAVYFKGGARRVAQEVLVAQALHAFAPDHFPVTLAFDRGQNWWLTPKVAGDDLSNRSVDDPIWLAAVMLLGDVQRKTLDARLERGDSQHVRSLIRKPVGLDELDEAASRALALLPCGPFRDQWPASRVARVGRKLRDSVNRCARYALPYTWCPANFVGSAIVQSHGHLCVADVEDSYHGLPTLAVSRLLYDLVERLHMPRRIVLELMNAYVEAWQGRLNVNALRGLLAETWTCGPLFAFVRQLDRQARARGFWSAPDYELPADLELHEEAHSLGTFVLEQTSVHRSFRHGPVDPPPFTTHPHDSPRQEEQNPEEDDDEAPPDARSF